MDPLPKVAPPPPARTDRRYAAAALGLTLLALSSVLAAGAAVDPRNQFGHPAGWGPFEPLVPDWPAQKLALLEAAEPAPTALVLGTSRGMALPADAIGGAFNLAFPGQEVVTVGPLYRHLAAEGLRPQRIVHAIDQWALRDHREDRVAASAARAALGLPAPGAAERVRDLAGTLSAGYVLDLARSVGYALGPGYPEAALSFEADGTLRHPAFEAGRRDGTFDQEAAIRRELPALQGVFGERRAIDPAAAQALGAFLDAAAANGTRVQAFLPPLHPAALAALRETPRFGAFTQAVRDALLAHCGPLVEAYDFTDPASIGADPADFYDSHHGYHDTGRRVLAAIDAGQGNLCGGRDA